MFKDVRRMLIDVPPCSAHVESCSKMFADAWIMFQMGIYCPWWNNLSSVVFWIVPRVGIMKGKKITKHLLKGLDLEVFVSPQVVATPPLTRSATPTRFWSWSSTCTASTTSNQRTTKTAGFAACGFFMLFSFCTDTSPEAYWSLWWALRTHWSSRRGRNTP